MNEYKVTFFCCGLWEITKIVYAPHSYQALEIANTAFDRMFKRDTINKVTCVETEEKK